VARVQHDSLIGIAGGKVYSHDSPHILLAAGGSTSHRSGLVGKLGLREGWQYDKPTFVDWVDGCSILLRRDVVSRIGFLDEGYGFYREDVDICYRANRFGYRVLFVPSSIVWHKVSRTVSKTDLKTYYFWRSWIRFCLVNLPLPFAILGSLYAVGYFFLLTGLQGLLKGKRNELGHGIRATLWNLFSLKRTLRQRSYVNWLMSHAPPFST
jgi:GT2 family glycosyltransferase